MNPLDAIEIPVPCPAKWEEMKGDDRVRFCASCRLHVYNLSGMGRKEAEALVTGATGRLCVQLYRRPDGTVLTRSCRAVRWMRRSTRTALGAVAAGILGFLSWTSWSFALGFGKDGMEGVKAREPFRTVVEWIEGPPLPSVRGKMIMGEVAPPPGPIEGS